jgi:hypothetical protein
MWSVDRRKAGRSDGEHGGRSRSGTDASQTPEPAIATAAVRSTLTIEYFAGMALLKASGFVTSQFFWHRPGWEIKLRRRGERFTIA